MLLRFFRKKKFYFLLIFLVVLITKMTTAYFGESIKAYIRQTAQDYCEEITINAIREEVIAKLEDNTFMKSNFDSNGKLTYSYLDTKLTNQVLVSTSTALMKSMDQIGKQNDFEKINIPFGYFFSRNIFVSNGTKIPIKLEAIGSQKTEIVPTVKEYGINSSLVEIALVITLEVQVMIPLQEDVFKDVINIPLSLEIINSDVPHLYLGN